jgi:class 3 adenylate cyclase
MPLSAVAKRGLWRPRNFAWLTRLARTYQINERRPQPLGLPLAEPIEIKRRLAAIFAADVEGYSRLMGADEVATLDALTARRVVLDGLIATYGGRIANTAGDSVLAEFGSAVDAVRCAMEAQDALAKANSTIPEARHINFRIGVHVGDVMVRAGDLFGDNVNIAARLQTLARAGGFCISGVTSHQRRVRDCTAAKPKLRLVAVVIEEMNVGGRGRTPDWCPWPESNQHSLRNSILSRARLPVPPQGPSDMAL